MQYRLLVPVIIILGFCGFQIYQLGRNVVSPFLFSARFETHQLLLSSSSYSSSSSLKRPTADNAIKENKDILSTQEHVSFVREEIKTLLIPFDGPDARMTQRVMAAFQNSPNTTELRNEIEECGITSQVQLIMLPEGPWRLQTFDAQGKPKTRGGDEFYVSFMSSAEASQEYQKLWDEEPDHPTATAMVTDQMDGTYTLDFVRSPMSLEEQMDDTSLQAGELTIHFVYSCGIGDMAPPTKETWQTGGAIQLFYSVTLDRGPTIHAFVKPQTQVYLDSFDFVLFVGDSLMGQFVERKSMYLRSNLRSNGHSYALNTQSVQGFVDAVVGFTKKLLADKPSIQNLGVVLGSSTWDILADSMGQGATFTDHAQALRTYITQVRQRLGELGLPAPPTVLWKSATALHAHVVVDKTTKFFGAPGVALKRIKYELIAFCICI